MVHAMGEAGMSGYGWGECLGKVAMVRGSGLAK